MNARHARAIRAEIQAARSHAEWMLLPYPPSTRHLLRFTAYMRTWIRATRES